MTVYERSLTFCENVLYIHFMPVFDNTHYIPSKKLCMLFQYIRERGVDLNGFVDDLESRPDAWRDSEFSIPLDLWLTLCRSAAHTLGDPDFGFGLGRHFWGLSTTLGHLMAACRTLGEAYASYERYQETELHSWRLSIRECGEECEILFEPLSPVSRDRLILDFVLVSMLGTAGRLTGEDMKVRSIRFAYPKPVDISMHRKLFSCPIEFDAPETVLIVDKAELDAPILTASREVRELLEAALEKNLRQQTQEWRYSVKVMEAVARLKGGTVPDAVSVARDLGIGIRGLQLKLKQEGATFSKLKAACQSEMAMDYLKDTDLGIKEIAYILGFSDTRAFHRAFLRWTGRTPGEVRKEYLPAQ